VIARLTGILDSADEESAVIDVAGVGYLVFCSARTLRALAGADGGIGGRIGERVSLLIETHVREDHIHLYGFADAAERDWFRLLTTVQGVGARVALAVLSALAPRELADAVMAEDKAMLTRAQGVGPRLAVRILTELRDKVAEMAAVRRVEFGAAPRADDGSATGGPANDAISALVNLGYRRGDAFGAVAHAARELGGDATVEALVRAGLRELSA
jgi:Holliday junction DNA helicase RuvA